MRCKPPRRGFTLFEMMVVLGLLGVVSVLGVRVFRSANRMQLDAAARQSAATSFDRAISQLRSDAWAASSFDCPDEHTLRVTSNPGRTVEWQFVGDALTRTGSAGEREQRWSRMGAEIRFRPRGPTVRVEAATAHQPPQQMTLVSQQMLLAGGSR